MFKISRFFLIPLIVAAFGLRTACAEEPQQAPAAAEQKAEIAAPPEQAAEPAAAVEQAAAAPAKTAAAPAANGGLESACAKCLLPVAKTFEWGRQEIEKFIKGLDYEIGKAAAEVPKIKEQIQNNEGRITDLKLSDPKANKAEIKRLARENDQLWKDYRKAQGEVTQICQRSSREVTQLVSKLQAEVTKAFKEARMQMK